MIRNRCVVLLVVQQPHCTSKHQYFAPALSISINCLLPNGTTARLCYNCTTEVTSVLRMQCSCCADASMQC